MIHDCWAAVSQGEDQQDLFIQIHCSDFFIIPQIIRTYSGSSSADWKPAENLKQIQSEDHWSSYASSQARLDFLTRSPLWPFLTLLLTVLSVTGVTGMELLQAAAAPNMKRRPITVAQMELHGPQRMHTHTHESGGHGLSWSWMWRHEEGEWDPNINLKTIPTFFDQLHLLSRFLAYFYCDRQNSAF